MGNPSISLYNVIIKKWLILTIFYTAPTYDEPHFVIEPCNCMREHVAPKLKRKLKRIGNITSAPVFTEEHHNGSQFSHLVFFRLHFFRLSQPSLLILTHKFLNHYYCQQHRHMNDVYDPTNQSLNLLMRRKESNSWLAGEF